MTLTQQEKAHVMIRRTLARCARYRVLLRSPERYSQEGCRFGLKMDQKHLLKLRAMRQTGEYPKEH